MQYVLLTSVKKEAENVEWWMDQTETEKEDVRIFDSFEEAKKALKKAVKTVATATDFFPFSRGKYEPLDDFAEYNPDGKKLNKILKNAITEPDYSCEDEESPDIQFTDDGDWYYAFVANRDLIYVYSDGTSLKTNIHIMNDPTKEYYFFFSESDNEGREVNGISIELRNTAPKKKQKKATPEKTYETVQFGRYCQDAEGTTLSDLTWRVLDKREGYSLLVSEKIIDHIQFSKKGNNDWSKSDICKWLNSEFTATAFTDEEQSKIQTVIPNERVFLLSTDEIYQYFSTLKDTQAEFSDFAREKTGKHYGTKIREAYGFWWTRTANTNDEFGEKDVYVFHICNNGMINGFERGEYYDGVRPAVWIKN